MKNQTKFVNVLGGSPPPPPPLKALKKNTELASFPGLPHFYIPIVFTIILGQSFAPV